MKLSWKAIILILLGSMCLPVLADAQKDSLGSVIAVKGSFLKPLQKRDSVLIADQLQYGFDLKDVAEGTEFGFPDWSKEFIQGVTVVTPWVLDTVKVEKVKAKDKLKHYDIRGSVVITSFDEGRYDLPQIVLQRILKNGKVDTLVFNPQVLDVKTMPVDTNTYKPHDIKGQVRYPVTMQEVMPYILGLQLLAGLVILVVYLIERRRRKEAEGPAFKEPAHIRALRKLDKYRGDKYWVPEKQKMFYSGVTDALREYIVARYGVEAMEMTTAEIFTDLKDKDIPKDLYDEMKTLFERADYVKFAKYVAGNDENAVAIPSAVRFVTSTYQTEIDQEAEDQTTAADEADERKAREEAEEQDNSAYMPKDNSFR